VEVEKNNKTRITIKSLKVVADSQNGDHIPSIPVAGKWLENYGFKPEDKVTIAAVNDLIIIKKGKF
jgi:hypothetical protein